MGEEQELGLDDEEGETPAPFQKVSKAKEGR